MTKDREKLVLVSIHFIFMMPVFLMLPQFTLLVVSFSPNYFQGGSSREYVPFTASEESEYVHIHTASKAVVSFRLALNLEHLYVQKIIILLLHLTIG